MKRKLSVVLVILSCLMASAAPAAVVDSLWRELGDARDIKDSIRITYDIFDASPRSRQAEVGEMLYQLGVRDSDVALQLDMLRQLSNINARKDSMYVTYLDRAVKLPNSPEKKQTIMFIKIKQSCQAARTATIQHSRERLRELMSRAEFAEGRSRETRIEVLFTLCAYLEQVTHGELLTNYLEQLGELLDGIPNQLDAVRSLYLTQSALTYTALGSRTKAVNADRQMLGLIDDMEQVYRKKDRMFRDFAYSRYIIYRRMLCNFEALTPEEVEHYYQAARELIDKDEAIRVDFEEKRVPDMYYYMARKQYDKALPLLENEIFVNQSLNRRYLRYNVLQYLIEAAEQCGNQEILLKALLESRRMLSDEQLKHSIEQFRELQLIYNTNKEKLLNAQIELEKRNAQLSTHRVLRMLWFIFILILIGLIVVLTRTWRKSRRLNRELDKANARLTDERDSLKRTQADMIRVGERARQADRQKEEFINNMSHEVSTPLSAITEYTQLIVDCGDVDKKPYLARFAQVIKLNTELLQTLVNDVLDLASLDKGLMKVERKHVVIGRLAAVASDSIKSYIQPGVKYINRVDPDFIQIITTDSKRVTQVLYNLLVNAAKFTTEGSITLDGHLSEDGGFYEFSVTDTGIGIPDGKEEVIFNRFEKLNRFSQGIGLGLSVSRLVASLLGGQVKVDRTHRGSGARFIFTIPAK